MRLNKKQTAALDFLEDDTTTEVLYGGAAGGGKSILGCYWQLKRRLKYPGTRGLIGRANLKTLKETTLQSFFEVCRMQGLKAETHYRYNQQAGTVLFPNGSAILLKDLFLYPSDPNFDELGSLEITDAFIDECNQTVEKAWNVVKSRIRYKLDENELLPKMLGTCNPAKNYVYSRFYKPSVEGKLPPERKFIQALVTDNPDISKHYRENLLSLDENSKQRLLYGNWEYDNDPSTLIEYDKIIDCFTNDYVDRGDKFITCDVARFGSDRSVIGVWDNYRVNLHAFLHLSVTRLAAKIEELRHIHGIPLSQVIADEDGVGGGVVDILGCKGFVNNSKALNNPLTGIQENYTNLKSQCYFRLAERINNGGLFIDCNDIEMKAAIIQELEQVKQWKMDSDGKKQVMPKEKVKELIGRSPDFSDTLMMREWFELTNVKNYFITAAGEVVYY